MAKIDCLNLVIDWGFTRFKLWLYDSNHLLISQSSINTADISSTNKFYRQDDLTKLVDCIFSFISGIKYRFHLNIYSSSQMHCFGAYSSQLGSFLSTWNDPSCSASTIKNSIHFNGIPCLSSMPFFKVNASNLNFSSTYSSCLDISQRFIEFTSVASPVCLLFTEMLGMKLPCSNSWWQSSCLPSTLLEISTSFGSYLSEEPLVISENSLPSIVPNLISLTFFPEVGDLQASTYASFSHHDILVNIGTGSQVIVANPQLPITIPYFRYWPFSDFKHPVISHIPCGRLLQDYVNSNNYSFSDIQHALNTLNSSTIIQNISRNSQSLLYFPGFCSFHGAYLNWPENELRDIVNLEIDVFLSLWIYQYCRVIQILLDVNFNSSHKCSIAVTGALGGLSKRFASLLEELLPSSFTVTTEDIELPHSLMNIFV